MLTPSRREKRGLTGASSQLKGPQRLIALALAGVLCLGGAVGTFATAAHAASASKETISQLNSAERQLDEVQKQLDLIHRDYEALAKEQAGTLQDIEEVQGEIAEVEGEIEVRYEELRAKQGALADRVAANYKSGTTRSLLELVLSSTSFAELTSNIYYANKVCEGDVALIDDVRAAKRELEEDRLVLKDQEAELEDLRAEQQTRLDEMQAKQQEAEDMVANLSQEVKDLMAKRDAEIAESAAAEARQRAEAAKRAQSSGGSYTPPSGSSSSSSGNASSPDYDYGGQAGNSASSKGAAIVAACHKVPSPGGGLCAMWVSQVYQRALGYYPGGNANDMYTWCTTSNKANLEPGMIVAVSTHPHTSAGAIWGHVGIYIGDGLVMDNVGYVRTIGLDEWINYYDDTVPVRFGWL